MNRTQSSRPVDAARLAYAGAEASITRAVPVEMPVSILYGEVPFAVMMASPTDIEDFVLGFSLTEGIIESAEDVRAIEVTSEERGIAARVTLAPQRMSQHLQRKRSLSGRSGCGVCGVEDVKDLPAARAVPAPARRASLAAIERAMLDLEHHQPLNDLTRAVHGVAWFDLDGGFVLAREDVGRHNALDKLVGALLREGIDPAAGFIVITSRCSFEMVEKAAAFGAHLLVAISAPTSLAIDRAEALGVTLVAVARHDSALLMTGALAADDRQRSDERIRA